ncbi:hypothetical protein [Embleya sp. NPDC050493]|uniref:hypothetical protein n=1 Tax=Embleya sp. NPDC050493 TaxID=3363989 RepID=UPI003793FE8C
MRIRRIATAMALAAAAGPLFVLAVGTPAAGVEPVPLTKTRCDAQWKATYWAVGASLATTMYYQCMQGDMQVNSFPPVPELNPVTIDPTWGTPTPVRPRP